MEQLKRFLGRHASLAALIILGMALSLLSPIFFTPRNLSNILLQVTSIGIIAVGMTGVILLGGIDLSVGSIVGLSAIVVTMLMQYGLGAIAASILTILLVGIGIGLWNGWWIAHYNIPAFIITLGMMAIARGLALVLSEGGSIPVTDTLFPLLGGSYIPKAVTLVILVAAALILIVSLLKNAARSREYGTPVERRQIAGQLLFGLLVIVFAGYIFLNYRGIPVPAAIMLILFLLGIFTLRKTKLGRDIYCIGGSREAAHLMGIKVFKTILLDYTIIIVLASIAGIVLASRLNGADPNLGTMFEMDAIASVIIGGSNPLGGSGTMTGTLIGTLIIGTLNNGMSLMGISSFYQLIIKGFIVIAAVWYDVISRRKKA